MKLKFIIALALSLFIIGCSSDDSNNTNLETETTKKGYVYNASSQKLVEVNLSNGTITDFSENFSAFDGDFSPVYFPSTNEIIGIDDNYNFTTNQNEARIIKINLSNGIVNYTNLIPGNSYSTISSANNKLYTYNQTKEKLVELNHSSGSETEVTEQFNPFDGKFYGRYYQPTNELLSIDSNYNLSNNENDYRLIKVNLGTGVVNYVDLQGTKYSELITGNNKVFVYNSNKSKIVEINPLNGNETNVSNDFSVFDNYFVPDFNSETNEITGIINELKKLYRVNITTGNVISVDLPNNDFGDLIIP